MARLVVSLFLVGGLGFQFPLIEVIFAVETAEHLASPETMAIKLIADTIR